MFDEKLQERMLVIIRNSFVQTVATFSRELWYRKWRAVGSQSIATHIILWPPLHTSNKISSLQGILHPRQNWVQWHRAHRSPFCMTAFNENGNSYPNESSLKFKFSQLNKINSNVMEGLYIPILSVVGLIALRLRTQQPGHLFANNLV